MGGGIGSFNRVAGQIGGERPAGCFATRGVCEANGCRCGRIRRRWGRFILKRGVRQNGEPFGSDPGMRKPKGLSWAGHKAAIAAGRDGFKAGNGARAYRSSAGWVQRIEELTAKAENSTAKGPSRVSGATTTATKPKRR